MADALDGDYSRSRAVLVGTWDYTELGPVPAARHSLERMRTLLIGPLCGWPADRVSVVANQPTLGDLPHRLVERFQSASDVALFYYVGHGQYDHEDRLCLALRDSSADPDLRTTTSLVFDAVRHAFRMCQAHTRIAILDCCFAGLAAGPEGRLAAPDTGPPRSPGCYLMMASGEFSTAWFQSAAEDGRPQTYFTRYLVDVVEGGIPGEPAGLTLGPIYDQVADALVRDRKPEPTRRVSDQAARFVFARNTAAAHPAHPPARPDPYSTGDRRQRRRPLPRGQLARTALAGVLAAVIALVGWELLERNRPRGADPAVPTPPTTSRRADHPAAILRALPEPLRRDGGCRPAKNLGGRSALSCRVRAGDLVLGDLFRDPGIDNTFVASVRTDPVTAANWLRRLHRNKLVRDDEAIVAIDDTHPSAVRIEYLDTRSGLNLTVWGLAGWRAAQTFLARAGLP